MKDLFYNRTNVWNTADVVKREAILSTADDFMRFNDASKTERLTIKESLQRAKEAGFVDVMEQKNLSCGDKVYFVDRGKFLILAHIGTKCLEEGTSLIVSHTDCVKLDLNMVPIFEDSGFALLRVNTYAMFKKAKWTTLPLALYGTVVKRDGTTIEVAFGDCEDEPALYIQDISAHYAISQMNQSLQEGYDIEKMNVFAGSFPAEEAESASPVKENILRMLYEKYGMVEEDFFSAELSLVPRGKTLEAGFDGSALCGYGFDDRAAVYAQLKAMLDLNLTPQHTALAVFTDKEEVGFLGRSGAKSSALELFFSILASKMGKKMNQYLQETIYRNTNVLSLEAICGHDPSYPELHSRIGGSLLGHGIQLFKTPTRPGKVAASEADAETLGKVRKLFNDYGVIWQPFGGMEKVGGFGTVSEAYSLRNMNVVDAAICLLGAHSTSEFILKSDLYEAYLACKAFFSYL